MWGCNDAALMSQAAQAIRPTPLPTASTPRPHAVKNRLRPGVARASSLLDDPAWLVTLDGDLTTAPRWSWVAARGCLRQARRSDRRNRSQTDGAQPSARIGRH